MRSAHYLSCFPFGHTFNEFATEQIQERASAFGPFKEFLARLPLAGLDGVIPSRWVGPASNDQFVLAALCQGL
jgi:hypothetical protein